jgi:uncharacterized integral membrane protein
VPPGGYGGEFRPVSNIPLYATGYRLILNDKLGEVDMAADGHNRHVGGAVSRFALRNATAIALIALAAVFIGQNRDRQRIHLLWITVESPMWLLLSAMLVVGVAVGLLLHRRRRN